SDWSRGGPRVGGRLAVVVITLALSRPLPAAAQSATPCDLTGPAAQFPRIPNCAFVGAYQDSSLVEAQRCLGTFHGPLPRSTPERPRRVPFRFGRARRIEARKDFGGYRISRVVNYPGPADTSRMVLIRRFSRQTNDEITWNFSTVDTSLQFRCKGGV